MRPGPPISNGSSILTRPIRWQVMRDLIGEAPDAVAAERSRVATEGWGAQLLALQSPAGKWANAGCIEAGASRRTDGEQGWFEGS